MALAMVSTVSTARGTAGSPRLSRRALTTKSASDFRSITWSASSAVPSRDALIRGTRRVMTSVFVSRDVVLRRSTRTRGRDARRPSGTRNVTPMASKSFDPSTSYIEGLTPLSEICDDFVCKSSPAVEGSLRQIATDICAVRESKRSQEPYAPDVAFDDGSRRFVGFDGFATHTFIKDTIGNPKCAVTKMKMDANDSATLEWRLVGTGPTGSSVEINVVATLRMNLITGRVIAHTEVWDFGKVDGIAGALLQTQRNAFAAPKNLSDGVSEIAKSIEDAIGSVDLSDDDEVFADPNDPMKFFTETNKPSDDYLNYALFVAALWLVYEGLKATQTL